MNPEVGPTMSVKTSETMKTNILSNELLDILENGKFSSNEDFGLDSDWFNSDFDYTDLETCNLSDNNNLDGNSIDNNSL